jgi:hypothetical protein
VRGALVIQTATKLDQNLRSLLAPCAVPSVKGEGTYGVVRKHAQAFRCTLGGFTILVADRCHVGNGGHVDDGVAESGQAQYGQFPGFLQHVEACDHEGEGGKAEDEDSEGGQQFANNVELRQRYDCQECPQPDASGVLELALHGSLLIFLSGGSGLRQGPGPPFCLLGGGPSKMLDDDMHFYLVEEKRQCTGGELWVDWR